ncbi:hypothetical protein SAMN06265222_12024 [Neorhodopirellula lusitana]|uniref:Secreted protein n=1 Tax=Neorhodopirellula lusitana TaxID=445327 RepID=A0ABY1QMW8_9BACT|nr:hypothetical protein [Neorhodopirellula lusitana]SMP75843.1 hypothetical protein SAMN06265222_12024 [Neorhodopirellula lusitana]
MNISSSSVSFASQSSAAQSRPQGPPPDGKEQLSSALESLGVDDAKATSVLDQVDEAVAALKSDSSSGTASREAIHSAINEVLEANGIDSDSVEEEIRATGATGASGASESGGPSRSGRPHGPPPPRDDESDSSSLESALLSSGVSEDSVDELLTQILDTIGELSSEEGTSISQEDFSSALTDVLEENGVDTDAFTQAMSQKLNAGGLFVDRLA